MINVLMCFAVYVAFGLALMTVLGLIWLATDIAFDIWRSIEKEREEK